MLKGVNFGHHFTLVSHRSLIVAFNFLGSRKTVSVTGLDSRHQVRCSVFKRGRVEYFENDSLRYDTDDCLITSVDVQNLNCGLCLAWVYVEMNQA